MKIKDKRPTLFEKSACNIWTQNNASLTCYAIVADGQVVGNIGLIRSKDIERFTAEVEYYIGEDYWEQGIMARSTRKCILAKRAYKNGQLVDMLYHENVNNL